MHTLSLRISKSNDKLIHNLIKGKGIHSASAELASDFFISDWPDALPWPEDILRPNGVQNGHSRTENSDTVVAKVHKTTG